MQEDVVVVVVVVNVVVLGGRSHKHTMNLMIKTTAKV